MGGASTLPGQTVDMQMQPMLLNESPMKPTVMGEALIDNQHILLNVPSDTIIQPPEVGILSPIHIMTTD